MAKHKPRPTPAPLEAYRSKRNFERTPEPRGGADAPGRRFVVQKHAARRLHYDLRLELDGTLKSWAIPKGPSLDPEARNLAVEVEDHPLEYADFEGVLPAGEYGAGGVIVWDRGAWEPLNDPRQGLEQGDLKFKLHGQRLRGEFALVRMKKRPTDRAGVNNWLLIKKRDDAATKEDVLAAETSVISGRTLKDLGPATARQGSRKVRIIAPSSAPPPAGARPPPVAESGAPDGGSSEAPAIDPSRLPGAVKAEQPDTPRPQLAVAGTSPPRGDQWLHEIKYDGYRLLCVIKGGRVRLLTRSGQDWTRTFKPVADAGARLPLGEGIVDGEVVVLDARGVPDFQALQNAVTERSRVPLVYYAFDLPFAGGWDLRRCALTDRKDLLRRVVGTGSSGTIRFSDHIRGRGDEVFRQAAASGLEGIVSKRADARYESKRTETWRKTKARRTDDFIVGGFTEPEGSREALGALVLARPEASGKLTYRGKVGTGFDARTLRDLHERLSALERPRPAMEPPKDPAERVGVHWVEPTLVVEVEYGSVSRDGHILHASYRGLRLDKPPGEVPAGPLEGRGKSPPAPEPGAPAPSPVLVRPGRRAGAAMVGGVSITHPDRVVYPDAGITKLQVAEHYHSAAERILPQLVGRPLSLLRYPEGLSGPGFFQRHPMAGLPDSIGVVTLPDHDNKRYIVIEGVGGLLALVQFGTIEFHPWGSRVAPAGPGESRHVEQNPDLITFDLDPGEGVPWEGVVTAAIAMKEYLAHRGLVSFVKTSGGKGLHIVLPLDGRATWRDVSAFGKSVAAEISRAAPSRFTGSATSDRRGRIYIDHLRNRSGSTSVAAYSLRARPGAPVSVPLGWGELRTCPGPAAYTLTSMRPRLMAADPWRDLWTRPNRLPVVAGQEPGAGGQGSGDRGQESGVKSRPSRRPRWGR